MKRTPARRPPAKKTKPKATSAKPAAPANKVPGSLIQDQRKQRLKIYGKTFGGSVAHHRGEDLGNFAIDIVAYRRKVGSDKGFVIATNGLSDHRTPRSQEAYPHTELLWYVRKVTDDDVKLLYAVATQPFTTGKPIKSGSFQPLATPPAKSKHSGLMFLQPLPLDERLMHTELALMTGYFELLVIHPLSDAEFRHAKKNRKGFNELLDLFDKNKYPLFFDPARPSYV